MSKSRKLRESTKKIVAYNQQYKCFDCKQLLPPSFQCDHVIPYSVSRDDSIDNLQALCSNCHSNKSQRENIRIIQFKNLVSKNLDLKICWFCIETYEENHICNKVLKDIEITIKKQNEIVSQCKDIFNKYKYTKKNMNNLVETFRNHTLEEAKINLIVKINRRHVYVNNYIYNMNSDFTVANIIESIILATRSKRDSNKYYGIIIKLEINGTEEEKINCIDYLSKNLPDHIPERIFKKNIEIEFEFSYVI
jgi:hypothetical protein